MCQLRPLHVTGASQATPGFLRALPSLLARQEPTRLSHQPDKTFNAETRQHSTFVMLEDRLREPDVVSRSVLCTGTAIRCKPGARNRILHKLQRRLRFQVLGGGREEEVSGNSIHCETSARSFAPFGGQASSDNIWPKPSSHKLIEKIATHRSGRLRYSFPR